MRAILLLFSFLLLTFPAYADDCLAPSSKFRKQPPQGRESQLIASLKGTLRRHGVDVARAELLDISIHDLFHQIFSRSHIGGRSYLCSRYSLAPALTAINHLPDGAIEIVDPLNHRRGYSVGLNFAGTRFGAQMIRYDSNKKVFLVAIGRVTLLEIDQDGIITASFRNGELFPLGSAPPTFMDEDASQTNIHYLRGGIGEAVQMNFIKLLHPSLDLYYMMRLNKIGRSRKAIFIYPVFEGGFKDSFFGTLPGGLRYCDGLAADEGGKLYGIVEAGLHQIVELEDKFVETYKMLMSRTSGLGFSIGEELTFFVSGMLPSENGTPQHDMSDAEKLYERAVRSWGRIISKEKLPLPKRIIVEDAKLNKRLVFDISNREVKLLSAAQLCTGRPQTSSLGRILNNVYCLRSAV